jgi:hypothetical protein
MTRLTITLATAALSISFVPAANAYEVEPGAYVSENPVEMVFPASQQTTLDGACSLPIATVLSHILALPENVQAETHAQSETSMACADN